mmetsp:Transcript_3035/g.5732  ORF Transcript_3035/g.5732 Transcript_3035/m.5732 type:complete len:147 (-) Transcript_3035:397-837(-)
MPCLTAKPSFVSLVLSRMPRHLTHNTARTPHAATQILHAGTAFLGNRILGSDILTRFHQGIYGINGKCAPANESGDRNPGWDLIVSSGGFGHFERNCEDGVAYNEGEDHFESVFGGDFGGSSTEPVEVQSLHDLGHRDLRKAKSAP